MVKYYYDKYNAIPRTRYNDDGSFSATGETTKNFQTLTKTYQFNNVSNVYSVGSDFWTTSDTISAGEIGYMIGIGGRLEKYELRYSGKVNSSASAWVFYKSPSKNTTSVVGYDKGSLVESNIVAEDGTYPANGRHTDGFWYIRKTVVNQNPVIAPTTIPSGSMEVKPSFNYRVTDPDGNAMTVTESIDGIVFNTRTAVASGTQLTYTPSDLAWLRTRIKQSINITITADDGNGGVTTVNYPITRTTPAIDLQLKTPFETDVAARRLLLRLEGNIPSDAVVNVQACNNAFDASPTWENATNLVLSGFPYPFTNKVKTATKWGISFKVRIERGSSTQSIYLDGIGGAFD